MSAAPVEFKPFSIMMLTHAAMRTSFEKIEKYLPDFTFEAFQAIYPLITTVIEVIEFHAQLEDKIFYPVIETKLPGITQPFTQSHRDADLKFVVIKELITAVKTDQSKLSELQSHLKEWIPHEKAHLKHEEDVLPPVLPKTFPLPEAVKLMNLSIDFNLDVFKNFLVPYIVNNLNKENLKTYTNALRGILGERFPPFKEVLKLRVDTKVYSDLVEIGIFEKP